MRRANARRFLSSALLLGLLGGCAIAPPPLRVPIPEDAQRAIDLLVTRWHEVQDLRSLADISLRKGRERERLTGVLLARTPGSLRFEALSPFGQPFLLLTVHAGRLTTYNAAQNEASVGDATVEAAAEMLSLPVAPDNLVAILAGRTVPPSDLRTAEVLPADDVGPSMRLVGRYHEQRIWMDFETGLVRQLIIVGGRTEAVVTFLRAVDGTLTGVDLVAAQGYLSAEVRYRDLAYNVGISPDRFVLTLPKDAKINSIR